MQCFHSSRQIAGIPLVGHGLNDGFFNGLQSSTALHKHRMLGGIDFHFALIQAGVISGFAGSLGNRFQPVFQMSQTIRHVDQFAVGKCTSIANRRERFILSHRLLAHLANAKHRQGVGNAFDDG